MRRPVHLFWGIVCLLIGAYFGFAAARAIYITGHGFFVLHVDVLTRMWIWFLASSLPMSAAAAFFIWLAARQLQRASGQKAGAAKIRWGRFVLGSCMVFFALKGHFAPSTSSLRADNAAQALGMLITTLIIIVIGITLVCLAFNPKSPKKEMPAETLVR